MSDYYKTRKLKYSYYLLIIISGGMAQSLLIRVYLNDCSVYKKKIKIK